MLRRLFPRGNLYITSTGYVNTRLNIRKLGLNPIARVYSSSLGVHGCSPCHEHIHPYNSMTPCPMSATTTFACKRHCPNLCLAPRSPALELAGRLHRLPACPLSTVPGSPPLSPTPFMRVETPRPPYPPAISYHPSSPRAGTQPSRSLSTNPDEPLFRPSRQSQSVPHLEGLLHPVPLTDCSQSGSVCPLSVCLLSQTASPPPLDQPAFLRTTPQSRVGPAHFLAYCYLLAGNHI